MRRRSPRLSRDLIIAPSGKAAGFDLAKTGLALRNPFGSALHNALADVQEREPALIAFLVTTPGVSIYGVGGAFWGLLAGVLAQVLVRAGASLL